MAMDGRPKVVRRAKAAIFLIALQTSSEELQGAAEDMTLDGEDEDPATRKVVELLKRHLNFPVIDGELDYTIVAWLRSQSVVAFKISSEESCLFSAWFPMD